MRTFTIDGQKYLITRDEYQFILSRYTVREKGKEAGQEVIDSQYNRYFSNYDQMINHLVTRHIKLGDILEFNQSIEDIKSGIKGSVGLPIG